MHRGASQALGGQAETLVAAADAAARWFRHAAPAALSAARTARLRAQGWRDAAVSENRSLRGPGRGDRYDISFALREAVEHAAQAVVESARYGVEADPGLFAIAQALAAGGSCFARAAAAAGKARAEALIEAKRWALEAERLRRGVRAEAHEELSLARSLKRETAAARLSNAAEALHQACDALAGSLAP